LEHRILFSTSINFASQPHSRPKVCGSAATAADDAPHVVSAHRLIDYFMDPKVSAGFTSYIGVANANIAATRLLDPSIKSDPIVYPTEETIKRLVPYPEYTPEQIRAITRLWQKFKTGQ
jgi:putrescine transport system substrate-binding protein